MKQIYGAAVLVLLIASGLRASVVFSSGNNNFTESLTSLSSSPHPMIVLLDGAVQACVMAGDDVNCDIP